MDTLSNKQAVANCLLDLALGYQHKFGKDNPEFVVKCCNTVLKYHPSNANAMLTKAEAQKHYITFADEGTEAKEAGCPVFRPGHKGNVRGNGSYIYRVA